MNYNAEEIANKLTSLMFSGYTTASIAEIANVPVYDVQLALNQQKALADRSERLLIPTINNLYNQQFQQNYAKA